MKVYYPSLLKSFTYITILGFIVGSISTTFGWTYHVFTYDVSFQETFLDFIIVYKGMFWDSMILSSLNVAALFTFFELISYRFSLYPKSLKGMPISLKDFAKHTRNEIKFLDIENIVLKRKMLPSPYPCKVICFIDKNGKGVVIPWHINKRDEILSIIAQELGDKNLIEKINDLKQKH